jgi:hypothetical protein
MEGNARLALAAAAGGHSGRASDPAVWDPLEALDCLAAITRYRRAAEIYGPDDRAEYRYRVVVGMVRKCAVREPMAGGRSWISCCRATSSA